MKDVYSYPKTLRNYDQNNNASNKKFMFTDKNTGNSKNNQEKKNVYLSIYSPRQNIVQQQHYITDYHTLTNNSQIISKKTKKNKTKSKSKSKESHLTYALKQSLSKKAINFQQVGPQNIVHCKSLEKLQIISNDRSDEIKTLITQKALLFAENQELKAKLSNPTYRQQQFIQKIVKKDLQIQNLKQTLQRKEQKILQIEKQYRQQIQRLKKNFQQQLSNARGEINHQKVQKRRDSQKVYYTQTTNNEINPIRQVVQAASYQFQPTSVNTIGSGIYKISHSNDLRSSQSPAVINSTNFNSYSPKKQVINNTENQQFQTYVGEDGYERRVYKKIGSQKVESYREEPQKFKITSSYQGDNGSNNILSSYGTFSNAKISSYVSKEPQKTNVYKYSSNQVNQNKQVGLQNDTKIHNQNLYSKSLTFQCFNDQNQ